MAHVDVRLLDRDLVGQGAVDVAELERQLATADGLAPDYRSSHLAAECIALGEALTVGVDPASSAVVAVGDALVLPLDREVLHVSIALERRRTSPSSHSMKQAAELSERLDETDSPACVRITCSTHAPRCHRESRRLPRTASVIPGRERYEH